MPASALRGALLRARQLALHLSIGRPFAPPVWLSATEGALFGGMPPADQWEGLQVLAELRRWGFARDRDLLLAGLLHDMGKAQAPAKARYRMAATLLEGHPRLQRCIARHSPALCTLANHAALGAAMARQAELPLDVQRLIAQHHTPVDQAQPIAARLAALCRADALH